MQPTSTPSRPNLEIAQRPSGTTRRGAAIFERPHAPHAKFRPVTPYLIALGVVLLALLVYLAIRAVAG